MSAVRPFCEPAGLDKHHGARRLSLKARTGQGRFMSSSVLRPTLVAVVETPASDGASEVTQRTLEQRVRQQEILSDLGVRALQGIPFTDLLALAAHLVADGLGAEFSKVMEYQPTKNVFLVVAGVGWGPEVIGKATIGADLASPGGFALRTGKPVISNHLDQESRFRTPSLLVKYGIKRAINVILKGDGAPYGVLEVDSRSPGEFTVHDVAFLQGAANLIGMAIERQRIERDLRAALDQQKVLMAEINHRVRNSLQLVAGMLQLQAEQRAGSETERDLNDAAARVFAIAHVHESLYNGGTLQAVDLGRYLSHICRDLDRSGGDGRIELTGGQGILIPVDRAVPIALIVNELVTNAMKYAYPDMPAGRIAVSVEKRDHSLVISVRDAGVGLPAGFDPARSKGLGMRIIRALSKQLEAALDVRNAHPGAEFVITVPMNGTNGGT
jgi:two-component sensor histidine kinase